MNGSRPYSNRPGAGESSLDALNRTIEGLEARIEDILGRGGNAAQGRYPAPPQQSPSPAPGAGLLEGIRARQRTLEGARRAPEHASRSAAGTNHDQPRQPSLQTIAARMAAPQEHGADVSQVLIKEMAALRREMSELRAEARDQALPQELRRDLAGISASIDALGSHDGGADSLRLELDSLRAMVDRLAREDSVQALETRWQSMEEQVSNIDMAGLRDELVNLAYRVDDVREVLSTMPADGRAKAIENKITELSHSIEAMSRQPDSAAQDLPHQFDLLGARLDEITRAIAAMPAPVAPPVDTAPFERLEARLASVAQKIDDLDPTSAQFDLGGRIEHLAARVAQLADEEAVARLDARIERLQALIEDGAHGDRMPELTDYLTDISGKIEALDARGVDESLIARLDQLAHQIDSLSVPAHEPARMPDAVIGRLEALIGRAEATASRAIDPLPGLETLDAKLADIASKLQQAELTAAGIAMQPMSGLENVEAQLADISARLDRPSQSSMTIPGIEGLEARLADIAHRLDMSSNVQAGPSDEALRGLEDQIANLSRLVSSAPQGGPSYEAFDERFASIEEHLATSDEFVVEAARQAAEAAVSAYSGQMGGAQSPQSIANIEIITALADDLKALESLSRKTDDRTMRAFEAVQDTLLKIADRLERLDVTPSSLHHAGLTDMRDAVADARSAIETAMPQASTVALDDAMQSGDDYRADAPRAERNRTGQQGQSARTPSEAAALAAAFAASQETEADADDDLVQPDTASEKSFLAGLAARIRPGRDTSKSPAEPHFTEDDSPPLDPSMHMDPQTANMPLEPGSGAPDINRILQKVREAQAAERQRGGKPTEDGSEKAEFLASARRAAMAAAAEVETIGKGRKSGGSGFLEVLKSRRRPILMAAGAILLAIMTFPLVTGLLSGGDEKNAAVETAIVEPAPVVEPSAVLDEPIVSDLEDQQAASGPRLPEVRVIEPGADAPVTEVQTSSAPAVDVPVAAPEMGPAATSLEETSAISTSEGQAPATDVMLTSALDALPQGAAPEALKAAAATGNPLAFYEIGARFTDGRGVPVDLGAAADWYQRAADLGHAPSQYRIANFYEKGSGVERDLDAAKKWYQMAAEQGNASAMHNLAVLYATAGPAPDFDNAAEWFIQAAEVGVRDSQVNLAILYARGDGVPRDLEQSYKWFAIAANDGDKDAAVKRDEVFNALRPEQVEAARAAVANWTAKEISPEANAVEVPASWGGETNETASVDMKKAIRNIQAILNNNGFDAGTPDGVMGAKTTAAIKAFQASIGMEATGEIDDKLVKELLERNG
ncbi:MAG: SEL1-like repeat protein [Hoeflea sp.]|uniref:peptidoglycan-binding protein n=1 Tax=Hoeflea sp. TaxID=1940281 RepID=UPI001DF80EF0|nr:peptidoglycan-binding protein [Hoeflea sp.]MBU4531211.1 SEL1-like repeat protein [Alphaproteobacteria bacterium]MBU4545727.1 SEL1-like repeat protein [Alphaproteobacteria bacterium]MBU4550696.1 SEL1-like repeat protein [Alphaproteobacteria bacterium]MBV1724488.1 SEL1-like repeat protein [Hoeflea sp.]MBV1760508.1 SEL1-like repeat protein [Hoeflea sp.]